MHGTRARVYSTRRIAAPAPTQCTDLTVCIRAELERERAAGNRFVERVLAEGVAVDEERGSLCAGD
jgi:hypothetical protein